MKRSDFLEGFYKVLRDMPEEKVAEEEARKIAEGLARREGFLPNHMTGSFIHQFVLTICFAYDLGYRKMTPAVVVCVQRYAEQAFEYFQEAERVVVNG